MREFFRWIGEQVGTGIRWLVDGLDTVFGSLFDLMDSFTAGLTEALGISGSVFSVSFLILGLLLLFLGIRALIRRAFIGGVLWLLLGLLLLSWLIN